MTFRALILGAAAGGGLPQWNCGCDELRSCPRRGEIPSQTQSSIAVSAQRSRLGDPERLTRHPQPDGRLPAAASDRPARDAAAGGAADERRHRPCGGPSDAARAAAFHTFRHAPESTTCSEANPIFAALNRASWSRATVALDRRSRSLPGLTATLFAVPGKVPLYLEGETVETDLMGEQTVGVHLQAGDTDAYLHSRLRPC